ncbi:MAG TPA: 50S ribosomal protein L28 [Acholeplasmataceae bacterium]|nr:50S ribosomal protein L28 [Acholeplasmataceae bacterium]
MARKCYVTGVGTVSGNNRPHSLKATRRKWKANLQKVRIRDVDGKVKRVYVSTRALKSGLVERV